MATREVVELIQSRSASDGDGVKLKRIFGGQGLERFDPFLLMDEFGSDDASDYIGGFPAHPHRGFETITYMLEGKMEHRDHMNNVGLLRDGGVQWMTAGRGVIHSEMPQQTSGRMRGFQLWLNLPSTKKMQEAKYKDVEPDEIPQFAFKHVGIKALAGDVLVGGEKIKGYFSVPDTHAIYLDVHLKGGTEITLTLDEQFNAMLYLYDGDVRIGENNTPVRTQHLARLSEGKNIFIRNINDSVAKLLVIAGKPLKEPIAQYGPFVMNTNEEIEQAIHDYKNGKLTQTSEG